MAHTPAGTGDNVEIDLCDVGVVVLDGEARVTCADARARAVLRAESPSALNERVRDLVRALPVTSGARSELRLELAGVGPIGVRSCEMEDMASAGRVLLLRDGRALPSTETLLQQAARHRVSSFLSRDWAHDMKGMLHVIRINSALVGRLLQCESVSTEGAISKCLDAIPREVERLDRSIELVFDTKNREQPSTFDVGALCERLRNLIAGRAIRQRVEVVLEQKSGITDISGFEGEVRVAILNVLVNALEAMPESGSLVIATEGDARHVTVRVSDSGVGMPPRLGVARWRPHFVNDRRQAGIGLHVARAIVESHAGRIEWASNVPRGTCIEITFPSAASTGRI